MSVSLDGNSLYIYDLSANGAIDVVDSNRLLSAPPIRNILAEYPWILEKRKIIIKQLAQNFAASAKADFVCAADSMFLVNHPKNMAVITDFGQGIVPRLKVEGIPKTDEMLDLNLRRVSNLLELLNEDFEKFKQLTQQFYSEPAIG